VLAVKAGAGSQLPGLVHDSSASGSTVFIEPQPVIALGNRIRQLEGEERDAERVVLQELSTLVAEEVPALEHLQQVLVQLDLAVARARYGAWLGAVRPELEADPLAPLQLEGLRHPLLLWQEKKLGEKAVVPVSVRVNRDLRVVAITGPNTGGKTCHPQECWPGCLDGPCRSVPSPVRGRRACPGVSRCWRTLAMSSLSSKASPPSAATCGGLRGFWRLFLATQSALSESAGASLVLLDEVVGGYGPH